MDPQTILAKTYNLFLVSKIIQKESKIDIEIESLLANRDYNNMAKTLIYALMYIINEDPAYKDFRQIYMNYLIDLLHMIDRIGFNNEMIIKIFVKLIYQFYSYSLKYKIKFITDKEKREWVKAKLAELYMLIEE